MRCFGEYKGDRLCDLCGAVNGVNMEACRDLHEKTLAACRRRMEIAIGCPYRKQEWCDREPFWACTRPGNVTGKFAPDCSPTEECATHTPASGK